MTIKHCPSGNQRSHNVLGAHRENLEKVRTMQATHEQLIAASLLMAVVIVMTVAVTGMVA